MLTLRSLCAPTVVSVTRRMAVVSVAMESYWWPEVKKVSFVCSTSEAESLSASSLDIPSECVWVGGLYALAYECVQANEHVCDWSKTNPPSPHSGRYTSPPSCLMVTVCYRGLMICHVVFGTSRVDQNSALTLTTPITYELQRPAD